MIHSENISLCLNSNSTSISEHVRVTTRDKKSGTCHIGGAITSDNPAIDKSAVFDCFVAADSDKHSSYTQVYWSTFICSVEGIFCFVGI